MLALHNLKILSQLSRCITPGTSSGPWSVSKSCHCFVAWPPSGSKQICLGRQTCCHTHQPMLEIVAITITIPQAGGQRLQVLTDVSGITSAAHTTDAEGNSSNKGCLFSILGPSGAGKTTLLDILAGRQRGGGVSGQLTLNGHPVDGSTTRDTVG